MQVFSDTFPLLVSLQDDHHKSAKNVQDILVPNALIVHRSVYRELERKKPHK